MKLLELNEGRLAYWDSGRGAPLVFIHGVATAGELWARDLEPLAAGHRLIVYERRGYGRSSASPRNWRSHRDDAAALIDALDAKPAVLVGYSAGASIALDLFTSRPDVVRSLVLVDPAVNLRRCITPGFLKAMIGARLLRALSGERLGAEYWVRYVTSYSTGGSGFDRSSPERRETLLANASGIFADSASGLPPFIDDDCLAAIKVPITLIEAKLSPPFLRRSCSRLRAALPQARVSTIANAGHHITVDARDELLAILRESARGA
jgi:pimeloyl-ACP methyl ester carboxylesterase